MKRKIILLLLSILLVGCGQDYFEKYKNDYIVGRNLSNIQDVLVYGDHSYIDGVIFTAKTVNNEEDIFYFEGLPGSGSGKYANGAYTGDLLRISEEFIVHIYEGGDFGYDQSYFVGILCKEVKDVLYKNESIDFQTVDITLNGEKISLTVWLMSFDNGNNINVEDFSYE